MSFYFVPNPKRHFGAQNLLKPTGQGSRTTGGTTGWLLTHQRGGGLGVKTVCHGSAQSGQGQNLVGIKLNCRYRLTQRSELA